MRVWRGRERTHVLTEPVLEDFERFMAGEGLRLRRALVARFGVDVGNEVANDALAHAWEHWAEVATMPNRVGYLYRVAQSAARRHWRWQRRVQLSTPDDRTHLDRYDDGLLDALGALTHPQRVAVLLVHGHGYRYADVAEVLGISTAAVTNHVHRGLQALRRHLGEDA
jgi:DNA-directed RNA polymerase specialized sigma24 family protein